MSNPNSGKIDPDCEHLEQFVAFYGNQVIDYGVNPNQLREKAAKRLGIHPERIVISYLETWQ